MKVVRNKCIVLFILCKLQNNAILLKKNKCIRTFGCTSICVYVGIMSIASMHWFGSDGMITLPFNSISTPTTTAISLNKGVGSVKQETREEKIERFVREFNDEQLPLYKCSLQYSMHKLLNDHKTLIQMNETLDELDTAYKSIERLTNSFINSRQIYYQDIKPIVISVKQAHYTKMKLRERDKPKVDYIVRDKATLTECIEQCDEAYKIKEAALVQLRKEAKDAIVVMFDVFLILREVLESPIYMRHALPSLFVYDSMRRRPEPNAIACIMKYYMRLCFDGVVLINTHIVNVAFNTLKDRTRFARI